MQQRQKRFYAVDPVSLLPTLVRDLARGEEVIASEASDSTLVLNRQTSRLHRLSADALTAYGSVGTGSNANAGEHFIGPVLAAALDTDTALLDFGTTAAGNTSTKRFTLRNSGALPVTVTGLRLSAEAAVAAALTSGEFTVSKDDCSGRTLCPMTRATSRSCISPPATPPTTPACKSPPTARRSPPPSI